MTVVKEEIVRSSWRVSPMQWAIFGSVVIVALTNVVMMLRVNNYTSGNKTNYIQNPWNGEVLPMKNVSYLKREPEVVKKFVREWVTSCHTWLPSDNDSGVKQFGVGEIPTKLAICMMAVEGKYRGSKIKEIAQKYKEPAIGFPLDKFLSGNANAKLSSVVEPNIDIVNLAEYDKSKGRWSLDLIYSQRIMGMADGDRVITYSGKMLLKAVPPSANVWPVYKVLRSNKDGTNDYSLYAEGVKRMQSKGLMIESFD